MSAAIALTPLPSSVPPTTMPALSVRMSSPSVSLPRRLLVPLKKPPSSRLVTVRPSSLPRTYARVTRRPTGLLPKMIVSSSVTSRDPSPTSTKLAVPASSQLPLTSMPSSPATNTRPLSTSSLASARVASEDSALPQPRHPHPHPAPPPVPCRSPLINSAPLDSTTRS